MRTRKGLPFVCTAYMKLLLESVLARVQRDFKVELCHLLWLGNHPHFIVVAQDSAQCVRFYGEVQKQLTEAVKRLLGVKWLSLWKKNGTSVILYGDLEGVTNRIAYLYANPARANLVDSVDRYPGLSSWRPFREAAPTLSATYTKSCPWIRSPAIPKLPSCSVTAHQDAQLTERMKKSAKMEHELTFRFNTWMRVFGITDDEVQRINERIFALNKEMEAEARQKRTALWRKPLGETKLVQQGLTLGYTTKNDSRRICVYAADAKIRMDMIAAYRQFCEQCRECYERWKCGDYTVSWPPGAFLPAMPPRANYLYVP